MLRVTLHLWYVNTGVINLSFAFRVMLIEDFKLAYIWKYATIQACKFLSMFLCLLIITSIKGILILIHFIIDIYDLVCYLLFHYKKKILIRLFYFIFHIIFFRLLAIWIWDRGHMIIRLSIWTTLISFWKTMLVSMYKMKKVN